MITNLYIRYLINQFVSKYPDSASQAHIVLQDFNLFDEHIDFVIKSEKLDKYILDFLLFLREIPEDTRLKYGAYDDNAVNDIYEKTGVLSLQSDEL